MLHQQDLTAIFCCKLLTCVIRSSTFRGSVALSARFKNNIWCKSRKFSSYVFLIQIQFLPTTWFFCFFQIHCNNCLFYSTSKADSPINWNVLTTKNYNFLSEEHILKPSSGSIIFHDLKLRVVDGRKNLQQQPVKRKLGLWSSVNAFIVLSQS